MIIRKKDLMLNLLPFAVGLAVVSSVDVARAAPHESAVYCQRDRGAWEMFAGKVQPDGRLYFGISVWEGPQNITVYGIAERSGAHWEFSKNMDLKNPDERCHLTITFKRDGSLLVMGDDRANCTGGELQNSIPSGLSDKDLEEYIRNKGTYSGGYGTSIETIIFDKNKNLGKVTSELSDVESFFQGSGLLDSDKCNSYADDQSSH